jgi:DNA polymerase-3 subunit chi
MTEIGFYHLTRTPLERALPRLLEKALAAGKRAVVRAGSDERVEFLNAALWTYDPASFLPHGTAKEGEAARQPIWLTAAAENPNGARILVLTDGATADDPGDYERCLEMFDGRDQQAVDAARARWRGYRESGHVLAYWQQTESGGWEKKAEG